MRHGDRPVDVDEVLATAEMIERTVTALQEAHPTADPAPQALLAGAWQTPGASTTFHNKWSEWTAGVNRILQVGPELAQWLRNYARDAQGLDGEHAPPA